MNVHNSPYKKGFSLTTLIINVWRKKEQKDNSKLRVMELFIGSKNHLSPIHVERETHDSEN